MRNRRLSQRPENFNIKYDHPLAQGLVFAGLGNSPSSEYYHDSSIFGCDGKLMSMTPVVDWEWSEQIKRWTVRFRGVTNSCIDFPARPQNALSIAGTVSMWARPSSTLTLQSLFNKGSAPSWIYNHYGIYWQNDGRFHGNISDEVSSLGALGSTAQTPVITDYTKMYHLCFTWDTTIDKATMYFNGVFSNSHNTTIIPPATTTDFEIGRTNNYNGYYFLGPIADVMLYNRALQPHEAMQLANAADPMLNGMLESTQRRYYPAYVYSSPTIERPRFLRLSTYNRRSLLLWKR